MRHSARLLLFPVLATLAVAASISNASVVTSGLHGSVRRGPIDPVCQPVKPCTAPAAGVRISFARGADVHHVRSNARGHYSIQLAPGRYAVRIASARFGYAPRSATVSRARRSVLNIVIDTGIR